LPEDEEILTKAGLKKIQDITIDDEVFTKSGYLTKVKRKLEYRDIKQVISIKVIGNTEPIVVTPEHKIPVLSAEYCSVDCLRRQGKLCIDYCSYMKHQMKRDDVKSKKPFCNMYFKNNKIKFKEAKDITLNDFLIIPKYKQNKQKISISDELMKLAGYYLSEGTLSKDKKWETYTVRFYFNESEKQYVKEICNIFKKIYHIKTRKPYYRNGSVTLCFTSKEAYNFLKQFGEGAKNKRLPGWIFDCNAPQLKNLIVGYFNGDGCSFSAKDTEYMLCTSRSKELMYQLRMLFSIFDIIPMMYKDCRENGGVIDGRIIKSNGPQYILRVKMTEQACKLFDKKRKDKQKQIHTRSPIDFGEFWLVKVVSISEFDYEGFVYNIEVCGGDHTFIYQNVAVSNCTFGPYEIILEEVFRKNNMDYFFP